MSDGEDFGGNIEESLRLCKQFNITIYAVGIGNKTPVPIPLRNGGFKKDERGNLVTTKINEAFLENIALKTGGVYVRGTTISEDVDLIYKKIHKRSKVLRGNFEKKKIQLS